VSGCWTADGKLSNGYVIVNGHKMPDVGPNSESPPVGIPDELSLRLTDRHLRVHNDGIELVMAAYRK
jgi:hypothetical protein